MTRWQRFFLGFTGLLGTLTIALASIGAHGSVHERLLAEHLLDTFEKATRYALYHALALLALTSLVHIIPLKRFLAIGMIWVVGTLLFSGSLFFYALTGVRDVVFLTPIGGFMLIIGWLTLAIVACLPIKTTSRP